MFNIRKSQVSDDSLILNISISFFKKFLKDNVYHQTEFDFVLSTVEGTPYNIFNFHFAIINYMYI